MNTPLPFHAFTFPFSFFLSAFTITTTLAHHNHHHRDLLDANGNFLLNGGSYHIIPAFEGNNGGGLELAKTGTETSPPIVVQANSESSKGLPANFWIPIETID
ncbi:hypothetical protein QN277_012179 [Acacia crassicarpa]|uniref:Uncharacterized protein n=1 Tax=Acacia crassicarpa TaxID=499986 RepID=A0AAE1TDG3_9FABA|nr:hypothetical protein QN277_012179 [Acacia crassicarpa]